MHKLNGLVFPGLLMGAVLFGARSEATAGLIIINSTQPIPGSVLQYQFDIYLESGSEIRRGDYFTIYDIPFLDLGTNRQQRPDGTNDPLWSGFQKLLGDTPTFDPSPPPEFVDNPSIYNATWRYNGLQSIRVPGGLDRSLIGRFFISTETQAPLGSVPPTLQFTSLNHGSNGRVSEFGTFRTHLVPEPSSLVLMSLGAVCAGVGLRRRMRRSPA